MGIFSKVTVGEGSTSHQDKASSLVASYVLPMPSRSPQEPFFSVGDMIHPLGGK